MPTEAAPALRREFPVTGPLELSARLGHGSLVVHADDDVDSATVELTARRGDASQVLVEMSGRVLAVHAPRQGGIFDLFGDHRRGLAVDAVVRVPAGSTLLVATHTADVTVTGRSGAADLTTGTARIDVAHVDGDLRLRCGTSTTSVGRVGGSVVVQSGTGDVRIGGIDGALNCTSGSGRLETGPVHGTVKVRGGAGEIRLGAVHADVDLMSGSGQIDVGLPAGVNARINAQTGHGSVRSDLPVEDAPAATGTRITVRARTGTGDVRLFRAAG